MAALFNYICLVAKQLIFCALVICLFSMAVVAQVTCPIGCQCRDGNTMYLCKESNLTKIPSDLKETTTVLQLDNNFIYAITNHSLEQARNLEILSLENNRVSLIASHAFNVLAKLRVLNLRRNKIGIFPQNIFINNNALEGLDLSQNFLYYMPHEAIYYLFNLKVLNISHNSIASSFLGTGFRYTTHLQTLDFSYNQIPSIEADSFESTKYWDDSSVHFINLSYCNIRHIQPNAFKWLIHITGLSLRGNENLPLRILQDSLSVVPSASLTHLDLSLMKIPSIQGIFNSEFFNKLVTLNLSGNEIREIESGVLTFQENLINLDLSNNYISSIVNMNGLHYLEILNLAHNKLTRINLTTFDGLQNLKALDLSFNNLTHLTDEPFQNLWFLEEWDVSHNQMMDFEVNMGFEHLKKIDFSYNKLTRIEFVQTLPRVQQINLSFNRIDSLYVDTFSKGQIISYFNISYNGLKHIDPLTFHPSGLLVLDLSHNKLNQIAHFGWSNSLKKLYLNNNNISYIADNAFEGLNGLEILQLTMCNLYALPNGLFNDFYQLKELDLSNNPIGSFLESSIAKMVFQNMESLENLELSGTKLEQVPIDLFTSKMTLKEINLQNNHISVIDTDTFNGLLNVRKLYLSYNWITSFNSATFSKLTSLESLDISHNPFKCTCDLTSTCDWLTTTYVDIMHFETSSSTSCFNKEIVDTNNKITNLPLYQYCLNMSQNCDTSPKTIFWAIIAGILFFILLIMALVIYKLCTRGKNKQSQKMLAKIEKELESEQEKMIFDSMKYKYNISTKEDKL